MSSFKYPDLAERQKLAADAKSAMLKKFREATQKAGGAPAVAQDGAGKAVAKSAKPRKAAAKKTK
jgi:hypothetical protein